MLYRLKERRVFRHSNGTLDLCEGTEVDVVQYGINHVRVKYAGITTELICMSGGKVPDYLEPKLKVVETIHSTTTGQTSFVPHQRQLLVDRRFQCGGCSFTLCANAKIDIKQRDVYNNKVLVDFGGGSIDWFFQNDIYAVSTRIT